MISFLLYPVTRIIPTLHVFYKKLCQIPYTLIVDSLDNSSGTDVIFLDIRKAFDQVGHAELLLKLSNISIVGDLWEWFKSYLQGRTHCVKLHGHKSSNLPVRSGVPQGSILGPVLFLVYVNDLFPQVHHSKLMMFADDSECLKVIRSNQDSLLLQEDLDSMAKWCQDWNMSFNCKKCSLLRFGHSHLSTSYTINSDPISASNQHKDLGILLTTSLSWSPHISSLLVKAYGSLRLIRRVVPFNSNMNLKRSLYLSLVRSHLAYCSPIWRPHLTQDILKLEQLQRRATKFIVSSSIDYKSRLANIGLLPLSLWLEYQDILLLVKLMSDPPDNFHIDDFVTRVSSSTRASTQHKLKRVYSRSPRLNSTRHFYFNRVVRLWNMLPPFEVDLPFSTIKKDIFEIFWNFFLTNFTVHDSCTWFVSCPCTKCVSLPPNLPPI